MYTVIFLDHENNDFSSEEYETLEDARKEVEDSDYKSVILEGKVLEWHT